MILGCSDGDEKVAASIPSAYIVTSTDPSFSFRTCLKFDTFFYFNQKFIVFQAIRWFHCLPQQFTPYTIKADLAVIHRQHLRRPHVHRRRHLVIIITYNQWLWPITASLKPSLPDRRKRMELSPEFIRLLNFSTVTRFRRKICKPSMPIRLICTLTCTLTSVKVTLDSVQTWHTYFISSFCLILFIYSFLLFYLFIFVK